MKVIVIGSLNMDKVVVLNKIPSAGETVSCKSSNDYFGGKGANQAHAAKMAGAQVMMVGKVGNDAHGEAMKSHLRGLGIDVSHIGESDLPTGFAFVSVDQEAENAIVVIEGANGDVDKSMIDTLVGHIELGDIVLLQEEIPVETVEYAIKTMKEEGAKVILNPAPYKALDPSCYGDIDYLTPNKSELASIVGCKEAGCMEEVEQQLLSIVDKGVKKILITLGKDGVLFYEEGKAVNYKAQSVIPVDTTGAGDCFNGYFAAGLSLGYSVKDAIGFAQRAAADSVCQMGAQVATKSIAEMRE